MKLYHGSLVVVDKPEIRETSHTLDYGKGFYTTTSYEQAEAWVKRKKKELHVDKGYVSVYAAFALFEGGVLNKQELIKELRTYQLVDQYLFHTEAALGALTFIESKEVKL